MVGRGGALTSFEQEEHGRTKPLMVFDGDCAFCRAWIEYWKELTGERVEYAPFQEKAAEFPDVPREEFARAVQIFLPDGQRRSGAHAAFTAMATGGKTWPLWAYEHVPLVETVVEAAYRAIAAHRDAGYKITRLLWGIPVRRQRYAVATELFLRALGIIYLIAFVSFGVQAPGLVGRNGIYPLAQTMSAVRRYYGGAAFRVFPSVFLLSADDRFLAAVWIAGCVFALLLILGLMRRVACASAFVLYLSIATAGQAFMSFQWDALLLEAGFLAIFLGWSRMMPWMFRWLLFRLMFMSGVVKLASGDTSWHALTAMRYHYQTQPLPTPLAWYMYQLPTWFQSLTTAVVLLVELGVPFLVWFPRRLRLLAAGILIVFQVLIMLTGNYAFFNLLTIALCLWLVDDARWEKSQIRLTSVKSRQMWDTVISRARQRWSATTKSVAKVAIGTGVSILILFTSLAEVTGPILHWTLPGSDQAQATLAPFEIVNSYGLFAVMTTTRPEIVIEGSSDGVNWQAYEFKYKPGEVKRPPRWVEPHQPRVDWQMWFAALGNYQQNPWLLRFMLRMLQGSPQVSKLLARNPFAKAPPTYVRASVYEYQFTNWRERRETGAWWKREYRGVYLPALDMEDFARAGME
ncbi:MAG: lipase maturation factor family protein [Terriglobales bacterium]